MSLDEQHWLKLSRAWGRYRTVVDFANQSRDEAVHQALFNIFCREFTYRLEMAFKQFLDSQNTGYEPLSLENFHTLLKWDIVDAWNNSCGDLRLNDQFMVTIEMTADGRSRVRLFYRRDTNSWVDKNLEYDVTFPMLDNHERDEVYAKFL
jgi:hypothetical protein